MKAIVIYDSKFGNSKLVAQSIAEVIRATLIPVADASVSDIELADLVVVGSPTHGGMPTKEMQDLLSSLPKGVFAKKYVAAFDTRMQPDRQGTSCFE